jgi:hypothetical protein
MLHQRDQAGVEQCRLIRRRHVAEDLEIDHLGEAALADQLLAQAGATDEHVLGAVASDARGG